MTETKKDDSFEPTAEEIAAAKKLEADKKKAEAAEKAKPAFTLKNTAGKEVKDSDYFYSTTPAGYTPTANMKNVIGTPVAREDLVEMFDQIFDPKHGILFYKKIDTEVYIVIVPLKYSTSVGRTHESVDGDFQKHAISVIADGSVNMDSFKLKLKRIIPFIKYGE
ncbi:MAG: hypothetical protein ACR2IJ_05170 [Fluviibacter sp.]